MSDKKFIRIPFDVVIELITEDGPDFNISSAKSEIIRCCIKDMTLLDMQKGILGYYGAKSYYDLKKENPIAVNIIQQYFGVILWGE